MRAKSVELRAVGKQFGEVEAVKPLDLSVAPGEFLTLLGPSGCGKTTLLRMIAGLERVSQGRISVGEADVTALLPNRRDISIMFQDYALFPHKSVSDNIGYGLKMRGLARAERDRASADWLSRIGLAEYGGRFPGQLSGGQRQRVALARALILEPGVLLLDEPLGALDANLRRQLQGELKRMHRDVGLTFIAVTHDQEEALTMSDRIAVMRDGRIEQTGTPREIYDRPATEFVARFIGRCNVVEGRAGNFDGRALEVETGSLGRIRAHAAEARAQGSRVSVAVRPEAIMPSAEGALFTVEDTVFAGGSVRLDLRAADGSRIEAESPRGAPVPAGGEKLRVHVPDLAATVLAQTS
ncbi:MAG: ABC transporter ATP-binding protein [Aestuariivirga sp.]|uniref:ABC transporter ATP-binding protein n=1 Tax=Aestuariivirga sp. TaxID=2650926 RepID=UPI0025BDFE94|nr:ABC transporter ATP-binding protein [Aestuariivirga sp.]MCA3560870.1 ABC transporter ATP-binding protein [Aestuariivirga sp.]